MTIENKARNEHIGKRATDVLTGFNGIITGFCQHITGCDQYYVRPKGEDPGKFPDGAWLDANRLKLSTDPKVVLEADKKLEDRGGPDCPAPHHS